MHRWFGAIAAILVVVGAAGFPGGAKSEATTACAGGLKEFAGVPARVFCGPATATIHDGAKTFTITGGACERRSDSLAVNIGEVVLGVAGKPNPDYFGLAVVRSTGDGTYHSAVIAVVHAPKGYRLRANATAVLMRGRSRGTFAATSFRGGPVSGSFTC
jgi:hypothetical protein